MTDSIVPVVLCGGAGTRLWPLSRELYPKQLLSLVNDRSLLQNTVSRLNDYGHAGLPLLVCNEEHRFLVAEQLREAGVTPRNIILEPEGRNTAPAVALAALQASTEGADPILVVLPSDHVILDRSAFLDALDAALALAREGAMVTFGVTPTKPETGYGYVKRGEPLGSGYRVQQFVEKPDAATAADYLKSGDYYWNSGMFVFSAKRYLEELKKFRPDILEAVQAASGTTTRDQDFLRVDAAAFARCPPDSVDYAVMERTAAAAMVPLDAGWSDIGSWDALWQVGHKDGQRNVLQGDVIADQVKNSYIRAEHRLVSAVGVEDLVIVETADAVLIASQADSQHVKRVVENLKSCDRAERMTHRKVQRPWGYYESIDSGERFQVKRIMVKPGGSLSLQKHFHRAEHWVVVRGTARVTRDEEVFELTENESTFIRVGAVHRLENPGKLPLEIIEVQSGEYLGEDDIVRLEDNYGRTK